jgi:hypothetical protein
MDPDTQIKAPTYAINLESGNMQSFSALPCHQQNDKFDQWNGLHKAIFSFIPIIEHVNIWETTYVSS